jgi:CheY-like chemotaxis protein
MMVDNHMPRLTGIELARRLQSGSVFVPWILMSARIDERVVAEAEELHAASVLSKPFSLARLTEVLQSLLKTHYGWDRR